MADNSLTILTNCRICLDGHIVSGQDLLISSTSGLIENARSSIESYGETVIDMQNRIVAPGFLELQTNGMRGFHFTHFNDEQMYAKKIDEVARYLPSQGVTGFWATVPTVKSDEFKQILPSLRPRDINDGASLLGAHYEGPYLHPSKKGAHNSALFYQPTTPPTEVYGPLSNDNSIVKLVTLAPELSDSTGLISNLVERNIRVSLGHSSATYKAGLEALKAGASCLTHTLNAMAPLHHRDPGLAGLITTPSYELQGSDSPYFSIIPDGNHLNPAVVTMLFRSNPEKCILITDSIELAGLPDGTYPGHAQIPFSQTKIGSRVVIEGTETLIGGCASLSECVTNLMAWSACGVAQAVRCVTENVVNFMGLKDRGFLEKGRKADFVVLDDGGEVLETWIAGRKVWAAGE